MAPAPAAPAGVGAERARRVELADILRAHGAAYQHAHPLCRALRAIATCRTAALGGHRAVCTACGADRITYNSCRNRVKVMDLDVDEFLRRFLLHVVPDGVVRIRHFGLLANRRRAAHLARCRALLAQPAPPSEPPESVRGLMLRVTGLDIERCPTCQEGQLRPVERLAPAPPVWDTS